MSTQDLTNAIITGINTGGEQFLEGTLAAILPALWIIILGLHLGRPYVLTMIDRFTLRLGADLLWLIYVAVRDLCIVAGVVLSFMFFFPDVVLTDALPLTGGLAAVALFAALIVKLRGDPDHNLQDFQLTTVFLGIGGACYLVPYIFGVQANAITTGQFQAVSKALVTSTNPGWAIGLTYVSVALVAILGLIATVYTLNTGGRAESTDASSVNE